MVVEVDELVGVYFGYDVFGLVEVVGVEYFGGDIWVLVVVGEYGLCFD